jgi:hypothetical protein
LSYSVIFCLELFCFSWKLCIIIFKKCIPELMDILALACGTYQALSSL